MDREPASLEAESRERAASSEPSSTRPNPFEDNTDSARKRRRTSMTGGSRSRSVESPLAQADASAAVSPATTSMTLQDENMSLDTEGSGNSNNYTVRDPPRTPENNRTSMASHVTLSLRNSAHRVLDTIPSSPGSLPDSPTPGSPHHGDDVKASVEPVDAGASVGVHAGADADADGDADADIDAVHKTTSSVSRSETKSLSVEIVDGPGANGDEDDDDGDNVDDDDDGGKDDDDEDDEDGEEDDEQDFEPARPHVKLLPRRRDGSASNSDTSLTDPTASFPYPVVLEAPADSIGKLFSYMLTDIHLPQNLSSWIDSFLTFAKRAPTQTVQASCQQNQSLWTALPDLIWGVPSLRPPLFGTADRQMRQHLVEFCCYFAQLTAQFIELDVQALQQENQMAPDNYQPRDLLSTQYMMALALLVRRDESSNGSSGLKHAERDEVAEIVNRFLVYKRDHGAGSLLLLDQLLVAQLALLPAQPRVIDNIAQICVVAAAVVRENTRRLLSLPARASFAGVLRSRIALGHSMFTAASEALAAVVANHIGCLNYDYTSQQIAALGDLVYYSLQADHRDGLALAAAFQSRHPELPDEYVPDVVAMEWRFSMYCRLIMCSQMQLRVMAVTALSQELVTCWRRFGENSLDPPLTATVLHFIADLLVSAGVIAYLLGPTCHPEITSDSGNIIGFLAVTKTYTNAHTDLFWHTVTTTQDPRIADVLLRMAARMASLLSYDALAYMCQTLLVLPMAAYTPTMRDFCETLFHAYAAKAPPALLLDGSKPATDTLPFAVCLRLLRDSSVPGTKTKTPTAYPDVQAFAVEKLTELLKTVNINDTQRRSLYMGCIADIQQKSATTLGSLCAINLINRHYGSSDLAFLTAEYNLTELIVGELENAVEAGRRAALAALPALSAPAVISGNANTPRRELIYQIVLKYPSSLTLDRAARLWDRMVGPGAACSEDRAASWKVLNSCVKRGSPLDSNLFLSFCSKTFLSRLPPECFCEGMLDFLQASLVPLLNDPNSSLLDEDSGEKSKDGTGNDDDDKNANPSPLEQLWRIILTAPPNTVERQAISLLVKDVYIESRSISAFPPSRVRKVHLALVNRCLQQLSSAARALKEGGGCKASSSNGNGHDGESMELVPSDGRAQEHETLFIRSLHVLREFHHLYRARPEFCVPDLRPYIVRHSPEAIKGESAELKYQSFDGGQQTAVLPLDVGRHNTAGSLLASLKEVTGFGNYSMYYLGQLFVPQEHDICRSLEDLRIHNGLILVKKEADMPEPSPHARPGTSPVEVAILSHFSELWEYLCMDNKLAAEIHQFLVRLPVDDRFLQMFEGGTASYRDVFSIGQPYKSLYAAYALKEFVSVKARAITPAEKAAAATASTTDQQATVTASAYAPAPVDVMDSDAVATAAGTADTAVHARPRRVLSDSTFSTVSMSTAPAATATSASPPGSIASSNTTPTTVAAAATPQDNKPETLPPRTPVQAYLRALETTKTLTIDALCDSAVTEKGMTPELRIALYLLLLDLFSLILNEPLQDSENMASLAASLDGKLLGRLIDILVTATDAPSTEISVRVVQLGIQAVMDCCAISRSFWAAFQRHEAVGKMVEKMLLEDWRLPIRQMATKQINEKISYNYTHEGRRLRRRQHSIGLGAGMSVGMGSNALLSAAASASVKDGDGTDALAAEFREFFWPIVLGLIPKAIREPTKCEDIFHLAMTIFQRMREAKSPVLDVPMLVSQMSSLLLSYQTFEDITQPETVDCAALGLVQMLHSILRSSRNLGLKVALPPNFAERLFWKHLFPPWMQEGEGSGQTTDPFPRVIVNPSTRMALIQILYEMCNDDPSQFPILVRNLDSLVPCDETETEEPYHYDLPQLLDRTKAIRAPCGYVGLRNLSNTCYLNSLFTQLFMNAEFRRFMMSVEIRDENDTQSLLFQTRVLFSFMQDSIRRYLDTAQCVGSIKTYDDTAIDIHSQMDVDEFYNLLFDRWEGQLLSAEEKRKFRAFYGGQLVQQVRSKECEHVSERLEPFSAIQCDIKGKASLQESLQAYVDGEIMEGDNKYKCSTCDRHVDAVKRACLKDIPDHLIFHLKRFDFNLRTLQRSKINDYFSFPHSIDMGPYTIGQLSGSTSGEAVSSADDQFELVGVLVHSGTAESGHYYSYIRERPSSRMAEGWIEFNDDMVSVWDPSLMEASCFGGPDYRSNQYGADGNSVVMEKAYSAYMLFYQRSSSVRREQEALIKSGCTSPVRVDLPADVAGHIRGENTSFVRRHCLYDPQQVMFVTKVLSFLQHINGGRSCSANHELEDMTLRMALGHLDQVASRTKDLGDFSILLNRLVAASDRCARCSVSIFEYFENRLYVARQMIQRSPEPLVRRDTGHMLIRILQNIKKAMPVLYGTQAAPAGVGGLVEDEDEDEVEAEIEVEDDEDEKMADGAGAGDTNARAQMMKLRRRSGVCILRGVGTIMHTLWDHFHTMLRSWPETFGFMLVFVKMGRAELAAFLDAECLQRAIMTICADSSLPMEPQFVRMLTIVQRRMPNRPPAYENLIDLIDALLAGMYPPRPTLRTQNEMAVDDGKSRLFMLWQQRDSSGGKINDNIPDVAAVESNIDLPMTRSEYMLLSQNWMRDYGNVFVDKLIALNQNLQATDAIVLRLLITHPSMEANIFLTLKASILSDAAAHYQTPYLRVALLFIRHARSASRAAQLLEHISQQCRGLANAEGRIFFEVERELFLEMVNRAAAGGATAAAVPPSMWKALDNMQIWVPGLLGYFDAAVSHDVEMFVRENIFQDRSMTIWPGEGDEAVSARAKARAVALRKATRRLGVECLRFMQQYFVQRNVQVGSSVVAAFHRVVMDCRGAFLVAANSARRSDGEGGSDMAEGADECLEDDDDEEAEDLATEFESLSEKGVRRLTVDDLEEDASDWNSSRCSSEPVDSLGDASMQTAADLNDVDMP